jgi:hypothetical protein
LKALALGKLQGSQHAVPLSLISYDPIQGAEFPLKVKAQVAEMSADEFLFVRPIHHY